MMGILEQSWESLMQYGPYIMKLKSHGPKDRVAPHLWNALKSVEAFHSRVLTCSKHTHTFELYKKDLDALQEFTNKPLAANTAYMTELMEKIKELPGLQADLPASALAGLQSQLGELATELWQQIKKMMEDEKIGEVDLSVLQAFLAECALTFQDEAFTKGQEVVAEHLVSESAKTKMQAAIASMKLLHAEMKQKKVVEHLAKESLLKMREARGCLLKDGDIQLVLKMWDEMIEGLLAHPEKAKEAARLIVLDVLAEAVNFLQQQQQQQADLNKKKAEKLRTIVKFEKLLCDWSSLGSDMEKNLGLPAARPLLAELLRIMASSEASADLGGWGTEPLQNAKTRAKTLWRKPRPS